MGMSLLPAVLVIKCLLQITKTIEIVAAIFHERDLEQVLNPFNVVCRQMNPLDFAARFFRWPDRLSCRPIYRVVAIIKQICMVLANSFGSWQREPLNAPYIDLRWTLFSLQGAPNVTTFASNPFAASISSSDRRRADGDSRLRQLMCFCWAARWKAVRPKTS